jgi:hypothetical protein
VTWVRLADDFYDHPKVIAAGAPAGWLWACSLAYANRYLTDGFIPSAVVRRLVDADDPQRLAARLVDCGLWERADGGYQIHDFAEYQPSSDAVRAERERNAERARTWRERQHSAGSTTGTTGGTTGARNGVSADAPYPDPVPVPTPGPAVASPPLPPSPHAGNGVRPGRRRGRDDAEPEPAETVPLVPPTPEDLALWRRARADVADGMLPANAERLAALEPLGRGADGGLRLRAPPELGPIGHVVGAVRAALAQAGDLSGGNAAIVTEG